MAPRAKQERKVFKDLIRDAIYEDIIAGNLKPGDRIVEMEWADAFSSSQAPVREAIRDLEGRGVLESVPFKGSFVRTMGRKDLDDIHAIRSGLETVALNRMIREASAEQIQALKNILDDMKKAAEQEDSEMFIQLDIAFHEYIVDAVNMRDLKRMWEMCNIRLWTAYGTRYSKKELIDLARNHEKIYQKVATKDSDNIYEIVEDHFAEVSESLKES